MSRLFEWGNCVKEWIVNLANNNVFTKAIALLFVWSLALIPIYIAVFFFWLLGPIGFWQCLATLAICIIVLGFPQAVLFFCGLLFTLDILSDCF